MCPNPVPLPTEMSEHKNTVKRQSSLLRLWKRETEQLELDSQPSPTLKRQSSMSRIVSFLNRSTSIASARPSLLQRAQSTFSFKHRKDSSNSTLNSLLETEENVANSSIDAVTTSAYTTWSRLPNKTALTDSATALDDNIRQIYSFLFRLSSTSSISTKYKISHSSSSAKLSAGNAAPSDFIKIKLIGKGDVGRVFLVKGKEDNKLYAMKSLSVLLTQVLNKKEMLKRKKIKRVLAEQEILV